MTEKETKEAFSDFKAGHHMVTSLVDENGNFTCESISASDYLTIAKGYIAAFNLIKDLDEMCNRLMKMSDAQHALLEKYEELVEKSGI
jgi:hypothetical protein